MTTYEALSIVAQFGLTVVATLTLIISIVVIIRKFGIRHAFGRMP